MSALATYQERLAAYALGRTDQAPADHPRFSVHRNTVIVSLTDALATAFPVVQALVGEVFFAAMARVFITQSPPKRPQLAAYGDTFAAFIKDFPPAASVSYLADVARLEWARAEAYFAPDLTRLVAEDVGSMPEPALADLRLTLHSSVRLIRAPEAIFDIWTAHQPGGPSMKNITVDTSQCGVVWRDLDGHVVQREITQADCAFLQACAQGDPLSVAATKASALDDSFDLSALLAFALSAGLFINTPD